MNGENIKNRFRQLSKNANRKFRLKGASTSVGIDISDRSLEVVEIDKKGGIEAVKYNRIILKEGLIKRGSVRSKEKIAEAIKGALSGALPSPISTDQAVLGIPESQVFSHVFKADFKDEADLANIVAKETETSIPIPFKDAIYTYKVLKNWNESPQDKEGKEILIMAASKKNIKKWKELFTEIGIEVELTDFEPFANYRAILNEVGENPICLVDIGNYNTNISVIDKEEIYYSYTFNCGGETFTRKIIDEYTAQNKPIDYETAETIKIQNGLQETAEYSNIVKMLKLSVSLIVDEINTALRISAERCGCSVEKVILTGGSACMKNLNNYISETLSVIEGENGEKKISVEIGAPKSFSNAEFNTQFMGAVGLAMKGFEGKNKIDFDLNHLNETAAVVNEQKQEKNANHEDSDNEEKVDVNKQKKILALILIIGLFGLGGALYYRSHQSKAVKPAINDVSNQTDNSQEVDVAIPLIIDSDKGIPGTANGKVVNVTIDKAESYEKVVEYTIAIAKMKLGSNMEIFSEPIKMSSEKDSLVFPLDVTWLGYSKKQVETLGLDEVKKKLKEKFIIDEIKISTVDFTDKENILTLNIKAKITIVSTTKK